MTDLQKLREEVVAQRQHFRDGTDIENPASIKHLSNSNRAFGVSCALDIIDKAIEEVELEYFHGYFENAVYVNRVEDEAVGRDLVEKRGGYLFSRPKPAPYTIVLAEEQKPLSKRELDEFFEVLDRKPGD